MQNIFSRTELLIGKSNIETLSNSTVAVIGLGGVGSYALEAICRAGVGHILIVDADTVDESNINRQLPALISTVGQYKTDIMEKRLLDINPNVIISKYTDYINQENQSRILAGKVDYLIDAIDSVTDKIQLIRYCLTHDIPLVSAMGFANRLNPALLKIGDIKNTTTCPLARKVRRSLRKYDIHEGVTVVYSTEKPLEPKDDGLNKLGTISFVPGTAGLLLASVVIRNLID